MDNNMEEDEFSFTLFSDIEQNVLAMREHINEEVSEALREELRAEIASKKQDEIDNESSDDDIPLQERIAQSAVKNTAVNGNGTKRIHNTRRGAKRRWSEKATNIPPEVTPKNVDIIVADTCCEDEMIYCDTEENITYNSSFEMRFGKNTDSSIDEILIDDDDDDDDDDNNKLVSVKINWMGLRVHRFEIRKYQKFTSVFNKLAQEESVTKEKVLLILRDKIFISEDDTPDSLKLSVVDIIEGGITKDSVGNKFERKDKKVEQNMLEFKCVLRDQKRPLLISIRKTDTMQRLMVKASEQLERTLEELKFMFEGETLDITATPGDLDLEGGEIIHVHIKN